MILPFFAAASRTFFVFPTGDDAADGRSAARAWRTLARASREVYAEGDTLALSGTLEGSLDLKRPIAVRGPATIVAKDAPAIAIRSGGVDIRDLTLRGGDVAKRDNHVGLLLAAPKGRRSVHVRVDRVDVSGFGDAGISMTAEKGSPDGFDDVRISNATVHGVYGTGIIAAGDNALDSKGKTYPHHGLTLVDCDVSHNFDGNGIILSGVDGATVEFCRSSDNRNEGGGGLGMWAWCARRVVFRNCIANGIRSKGDGGGYDLDGGTVDCVVERCLSYDNVGPGGMHCDFPSAPRTHNNAFRDCVSVDDGRKKGGNSVGFGYVVWGSGLYDCTIERNLVVLTNPDPQNADDGALFAAFTRDDKEPLEAQRLEGATFRGNVVQAPKGGTAFVRDDFPPNVEKEIRYDGNAYLGGAAFLLGPPKTVVRYETPAEWRALAKADAVGGKPVVLGDYRSLKPRDLPGWFKRLGRPSGSSLGRLSGAS